MSSTLTDDDSPTLSGVLNRRSRNGRRLLESYDGLAEPIRRLVAKWNRCRRFRRDLKRLLKVGPHMIVDIGLTLDEALDQIETPFGRSLSPKRPDRS